MGREKMVYVTSVGPSVTGLIIGSSPIAVPRRDVEDIVSHSSRRASHTISRIESTIVTVGVSESISCTEFTNVPQATFVRKRRCKDVDVCTYPTGAANEFVAQKAITTVASAKRVVEDRWTIDE